jgi:hypothetical protein
MTPAARAARLSAPRGTARPATTELVWRRSPPRAAWCSGAPEIAPRIRTPKII